MTYTTWITQQSTIVGNQLSVQVARSVSRLKKAYITFFNNATTRFNDKQCITFYHPMIASQNGATPTYTKYNNTYELQWQIQLGSTLYPEYPVRSLGECFKILRQALNLPEHNQHSLSINYTDYLSDHFIYVQYF